MAKKMADHPLFSRVEEKPPAIEVEPVPESVVVITEDKKKRKRSTADEMVGEAVIS